ncbi:MAG TPA: 3-keto-5-aminohexanoate cleavage protein [Xanthobacteraceae bacterium]|nr:3-keto-5-aminohexanoate cleavage protein [Xanthobacteraceae bacterium]
MSREVIITCAITGSADTVGKHPAIPVTPEQIASSAIEAAKAGATIVHIHVRDPQTGKPSRELAHYREVVERIRSSAIDVIINLTTGPGANYIPSEDNPAVGGPGTTLSRPETRVAHIQELRPEICTLDCATLSFGERTFLNAPAHLRVMARLIREAGTIPELEVFDTGHIRLVQRLIEEGALTAPPMMQLCLGISYGAPATPEAMIMMRNMLPQPCVWAAFGISHQQFPMVAQAVILGGHVRVGLEDNLYLSRGEFAPNNAALVERAVTIVESLGCTPATPAAARKTLGIKNTPPVRSAA